VSDGVRLLRRLVLERRVSEPDGAGGYAVTWLPLGTLWADVRPRGGREEFVAGQPRPRIKYRVLVRAAPPGAASRPATDQRLREGERIFSILTVAEHDIGGRYLEIIAEEGVLP
jgi:head-tail adaptor